MNGNPILLLLLPSVFNVLNFFATTFATISFVLVFPTLPVIAITGISYKLLLYLANLYKDSNVSFTFIIFLSAHFSLFSKVKFTSCTMTVEAPFSRAFSQNKFPSKFSPFIPI